MFEALVRTSEDMIDAHKRSMHCVDDPQVPQAGALWCSVSEESNSGYHPLPVFFIMESSKPLVLVTGGTGEGLPLLGYSLGPQDPFADLQRMRIVSQDCRAAAVSATC